ncbi:class I adenylate-forming enzyme family protein [Halobacillus halophilus]|uniref:class I adenylate-forming enzyme family protein n=1 Tax=Halobacillus halophilus TaxID=1570 RepID=UPI001CD6C949|nr:class I adenylate-forming enzyme family protein [Halobacillus halophilus]MCA1009181.1 acyl--CoA ligase [Halobacillus halophilus]
MKEHLKSSADTKLYPRGKKPLFHYLQQHAEERPEDPAYFYYGSSITWRELLDQVQRVAGFLRQAGFEKGDRIGLFMQNSPQYIIGHYAIQYIGAVVCPLNPMYKANELEYLIKEVDMAGIFAGGELLAEVRKVNEHLKRIIVIRYEDLLPDHPSWTIPKDLNSPALELNPNETMWEEIMQGSQPCTYPEVVKLEDTALLAFTSGTTGRPKAAMLTYENALYKTAAAVQVNQVDEKETWLAVMPLCHIAGMVMGVNIPVYTGAPCVLFARFDPMSILKALHEYRVSVWYSIAPMNDAILSIAEENQLEDLKLNLCTSFGMPVTKTLAENWKVVAPNCKLFEASYGLSETHTVDTYMPQDNIKFGSVGVPIRGTLIKISDPATGEVQSPGKSGEIVIQSPGVFKGYWGRPEATAESLSKGWLHTGDIGYLDDEGYLYFQGRIKEMIKSSGFSIFPEDVEALLKEHPGIGQVVVIGVPDEHKGEVVKAFVIPNRNKEINESDLKVWAKENMAAYKVPTYVEFRDTLPQTSSGKILRRMLKDQ